MKALYDKFLNYELPLRERLLYITTFMCAVCSLSVVFAGSFLNFNFSGYISFALMCLVSVSIFALENYNHKTQFNSHLFLFFLNFIIFPIAFYFSDTFEFEIPVYALIGLVFSLVLMEGKARIIHFWSGALIVVVLFCVKFVFLSDEYIVFEGLSELGFIRTEVAILITSVLIGTTIFYRNRCLEKDMEYKTQINDEAEKSSYAKDMFLVNVSHEIRTPLNAIIGTSNIVLDSDASNHIKEMASNIYNSSYALLSITNDLLDFSNMTNDNIILNNADYDLSFMLKDIINLISVSVLDLQFHFFANINPDIPKMLHGDSGKLRQIITNFLSNACKYTHEGRVILDVDYETVNDGSIKLIIKVSDTGKGISQVDLNNINNPTRHIENNVFSTQGLGIPLIHRIANVMGGHFYAESVLDEGSTFVFEVIQNVVKTEEALTLGHIESKPSIMMFFVNSYNRQRLNKILDDMDLKHGNTYNDSAFIDAFTEDAYDYYFIEGATYSRIKPLLLEASIDWKKLVVITSCNYSFSEEPFEYVLTRPVNCLNIADLINNIRSYNIRRNIFQGDIELTDATVLVVDDNLINLDVTEGLLAPFKCNVVKATSGREAVLCIQHETIDFVLLDYMMPEMDGIDTLKMIRSIDDGKYAKLPVIAFTANAISGARDMFMNEGFDDYIAKPIEIDKLVRIFKEKIPKDKIKYIV